MTLSARPWNVIHLRHAMPIEHSFLRAPVDVVVRARVLPGSRSAVMPRAGAGADHRFFEVSQVAVEVALAVLEVEDGVRDELAGAVIRDVAAALDLDHLDVAGREHVGARLAPAAERVDVRMLDDEQSVVDLAALAGALHRIGFEVRDPTEPASVQRGHALSLAPRGRPARSDAKRPGRGSTGSCRGDLEVVSERSAISPRC